MLNKTVEMNLTTQKSMLMLTTRILALLRFLASTFAFTNPVAAAATSFITSELEGIIAQYLGGLEAAGQK